jgi:hypothetical protein
MLGQVQLIVQTFIVLNDSNQNFVQFCNFALSILQFLKILGKILNSFKLWKFWTRNSK